MGNYHRHSQMITEGKTNLEDMLFKRKMLPAVKGFSL